LYERENWKEKRNGECSIFYILFNNIPFNGKIVRTLILFGLVKNGAFEK
jgi:hypothetical protein